MIIKTPSDSVIQGCIGVIGAPRLLFGRDRRAIDSPALFVKIAEAIGLTPPPFRFDRAGGRVLFGSVAEKVVKNALQAVLTIHPKE